MKAVANQPAVKRYQLLNNEGRIVNVNLDTYLQVKRQPLDTMCYITDLKGAFHCILVWKNA